MPYNSRNWQHKLRIEKLSAEIRVQLGLDQIVVLDPLLIASGLKADVLRLSDLVDDDVTLRRARRIHFDGAASTHPQTGLPVIMLNCGRPKRRQTATLMEELSHLLLKHRPSRIEPHPELGFLQRTYDRAQETEAYDLGAALLLPKQRIQRDIKERECLLQDIADAHNCSTELVGYRIRRCRLWDRYQGYAAEAS